MTISSALRQRDIANAIFNELQARPIKSITTCLLCEKANIPRKAFYRYFESKDDVVMFLLDEAAIEYETCAQVPERVLPQDKLAAFFEFWYSKRTLLALLKLNNIDHFLPTRFTPRFERSYGEVCTINKACNPELFKASALFVVSGLYALLTEWRDNNFALSCTEMAVIAQTLLTQPFFEKAK